MKEYKAVRSILDQIKYLDKGESRTVEVSKFWINQGATSTLLQEAFENYPGLFLQFSEFAFRYPPGFSIEEGCSESEADQKIRILVVRRLATLANAN